MFTEYPQKRSSMELSRHRSELQANQLFPSLSFLPPSHFPSHHDNRAASLAARAADPWPTVAGGSACGDVIRPRRACDMGYRYTIFLRSRLFFRGQGRRLCDAVSAHFAARSPTASCSWRACDACTGVPWAL